MGFLGLVLRLWFTDLQTRLHPVAMLLGSSTCLQSVLVIIRRNGAFQKACYSKLQIMSTGSGADTAKVLSDRFKIRARWLIL